MTQPTWLAEYVKTPEARERARKLGQGRRTHGGSQSGDPLFPTYRSWRAMKQRCDNPADRFYARYGGRGVGYDPRWAKFEAFLADMGPRPEGRTIDRIDNDGNYEPANCRWATASEQRMNHPHARGWKLKQPRVKPVYGTKVLTCLRCPAQGTVVSTVGRYVCPDCRPAAHRENTARYRAKRG